MPRIRPARFVHVVYRTRQFDKMIAWYQAVFGCRVQYQNPGLAFLIYDDGHDRVAIINLAAVLPDAGKDERRGVILSTPTARSRTLRPSPIQLAHAG